MQIINRQRTVINYFLIVSFLRDYALPVTLTFDVRMNNALRAAMITWFQQLPAIMVTLFPHDQLSRLFIHTVFDLISEHALISGHPPFFLLKKILIFLLFCILFIYLFIISSDFREGNTSLLYTGLMVTRALMLRVRLLG